MTNIIRWYSIAVWLVAATLASAAGPLPSWVDGPTRRSILDFLADVTIPGTATFVAPSERIAVFDHDGTLWTEQPCYTQFVFAMDRVKAVGARHPEWTAREPFKSALAGELKGVVASGVHGLIEFSRPRARA